jgi:hypothetical protein
VEIVFRVKVGGKEVYVLFQHEALWLGRRSPASGPSSIPSTFHMAT